MASAQFQNFKDTLAKVFMLDHAELDFGIYRIMNQKRKEIEDYLNNTLAAEVKHVLEDNMSSRVNELRTQLRDAENNARSLGIDPNNVPSIQTLKQQIATEGSPEDMENEVYSHLSTFFRRYYDGGDFISQRRYKKDVYAIPYEGEEVKLHWANADQYYIKTSEYFRTYNFKLSDGKLVEFTLKEASTEQNNNQNVNGLERRFAIYEECPVEVEGNILHINFTYELMPKATKQKDLLTAAYDTAKPLIPAEFAEVFSERPTDGNSHRTLLEKHLTDYVARNTFDYFIHKDLKGFLSRELDFFIKNEVLFIDDINAKDEKEFTQHLTVIKALKAIGTKIIEFLSQIENFQKKLWLKKKFVTDCNWCITLDRIDEELYEEIAANDKQREEWVKLFSIDKIKFTEANGGLFDNSKTGYSTPLTVQFLKENHYLVVDTKYFSSDFKARLLSHFENIDKDCDGILIHSENFQAINLIKEKYSQKIGAIYIDPPFNLNSDADYPYSTNYKDSTWLTLLQNRINLSKDLLTKQGIYFARCDYHGNHFIRTVLDNEGLEYKSEILLKRSRNEAGSTKMDVTHEYLFMYTWPNVDVEKYKVERSLADIKWTGFLMAGDRNPPERTFLGITITPPKGQHFSLVQPKVDKLLSEFHLRLRCKKCGSLYYEANSTQELEQKMKGKTDKFKFYDITSKTVFHGVKQLEYCKDCGCKDFVVQYLGSPEEFVNDNWMDISSYSRNWDFQTENSEECLERVIRFTKDNDIILDYFAGSGTTPATAKKMNRRWIGVDMGDYFNGTTLKRMKCVYGGEKSGIGKAIKGGIFKYMHLESYEDTLNNLVTKTPANDIFAGSDQYKESYLLGYMLDMETKDSLFNSKWFEHPFDVKLKVTKNNELIEQKIDIVETFDYLIGLNVETMQWPREGICIVEGKTRKGEKTLVIWRDVEKIDNQKLEDIFSRLDFSTRDSEFDSIYINDDNNLQNLRTDKGHWKVLLTEEEFQKAMFSE